MRSPSGRDRNRWGLLVALCVCVLAGLVVATLPFRKHQIGLVPVFFNVYGTALLVIVVETAGIFVLRSRLESSRGLALLGGAYAFTAPLLIANLLGIPETMGAETIVPLQAATAAALLWHLSWPLAMLAYARLPDALPGRSRYAPPLGFIASLAAIALLIAFDDVLPPLLSSGARQPVALAIIMLTFLADCLAVFALARRPFTRRDAWLAVGVAILATSQVLLVVSSTRLSLLSYFSRLLEIASAAFILVALVSDYPGVVAKAAREDEARLGFARERRVARALQEAFAPSELPALDGVTLAATYRPADVSHAVGGDFYDAFVLQDGRLALSIGDVTGHGLEAAAAMVRLRESLRAAVVATGSSEPARVLAFANDVALATQPPSIATALFGVFDPRLGTFTFASAGHPMPAIAGRGDAVLAGTPGPPLGIERGHAHPPTTVRLGPDDTVVLYTDGLIEVDRDPQTGERALLDLLMEGERDPGTIVARLVGGRSRDDVAMLVVYRATPPG